MPVSLLCQVASVSGGFLACAWEWRVTPGNFWLRGTLFSVCWADPSSTEGGRAR